MDDQSGNVIDGTARARQWRRSRSKAGGSADGTSEARSAAPKSIASSLLVPADMVDGALEPTSGRQATEVGEAAPDGKVSENGGLLVTDPSADGTSRHNLFLSADAAVIDQHPRRSGGRSKAALLAEFVVAARDRVGRAGVALLDRIPRPRAPVTGRARTAAVALCLVTMAVVVGAVIAAQPTHSAQRSRLDQSAASAAPFDRIKSALLSSVASALGADQAIHAARSAHPVDRHPAIHRESRRHTPSSATKPSLSPTTNYTASSTGGSTASTSVSSGDNGSASTAPSGGTSSPAAQPSSAGSGPTTAFGASGALGPGSSPNG